ncbi:hypothetical protein GCM10009753_71720 [Streptantibioticus ferralitis]
MDGLAQLLGKLVLRAVTAVPAVVRVDKHMGSHGLRAAEHLLQRGGVEVTRQQERRMTIEKHSEYD